MDGWMVGGEDRRSDSLMKNELYSIIHSSLMYYYTHVFCDIIFFEFVRSRVYASVSVWCVE